MEYTRKVMSSGKINVNGSQYQNELLRNYKGKTVELRGPHKNKFRHAVYGYEVYYEGKYLCFIETWRE